MTRDSVPIPPTSHHFQTKSTNPHYQTNQPTPPQPNMTISRIPHEPADRRVSNDDGLCLLPALDLRGSRRDVVAQYISDLRSQSMYLTGSTSEHVWSYVGHKDGTTCSQMDVAGTSIPMTRHVTDFDAPADVVFRVYNAVAYTRIIDPYAYHVETLETLDRVSVDPSFDWCKVTWTLDNIHAMMAARDFVTLDFADAKDMINVSKSVLHPSKTPTKTPTYKSFLSKNNTSRTYRTPLMYAQRVINNGQGKCTLVQIQWSDVGGIVPEDRISASVEKFGYDSLTRLKNLVDKVRLKGAEIPPVEDPMKNGWEREVDRVIKLD